MKLAGCAFDPYSISMNYRERITSEPGKRGGRLCLVGTRISVGDVLGWLAAGMSHAEIIADFPEVTDDDILACLAFASERENRSAPPALAHAAAI